MALTEREARQQMQHAAALKQVEKAMDKEIEKIDNLTQDDFMALRKKRLLAMKKKEEKKVRQRGHGGVRAARACVCVCCVAVASLCTSLRRFLPSSSLSTLPRSTRPLTAPHRTKAGWIAAGHGTYREVGDQKEWFEVVKKSERVVCHFYRPTTWRCEIIDKHLTALAPKHLETRFIKINAEKSPFLAERLEIVLLPTLVATKNNTTIDMIEGFTELGGSDDFPTDTLERRLAIRGAIDFDGPIEVSEAVKLGKFQMNTVRDNHKGAAIYKSKLAGGHDSDDSWDDSD